MTGFKCPYCGYFMSLTPSTHKETTILRESDDPDDLSELVVETYRCPNDNCHGITVLARGQNGFMDDAIVPIYPESTAIRFPDYIPKAIRDDYVEACAILHKSPKAPATLSRRCLQGMIRDFWGINAWKLNMAIAALESKIDAELWRGIDALRKIGNIGAHMESDINVIVDVEPHEAELLVHLIERLIDEWYISRHNNLALTGEIVKVADEKEAFRKKSSSVSVIASNSQ